MLKIKKAKPGDEKLLLNYISKLAKYEDMLDEVESDEKLITKNIFEDKKANALFLLNEEEEVIGFSLYFYNFSTFKLKPGIYIEDIYIDEEYRKQGYGMQLFDYYKKIAKEEGCGRIEWTCLDWNENSIRFYEDKLGATPLDGWTVRRLVEEQF